MNKNSKNNNVHESYEYSNYLLIVQRTLFLLPLVAIIYVLRVELYTFLLPYLYTTSVAGFILNLGNGKISINLRECKYIIDISKVRFKKNISMTSSSDTHLSKIDFYYQISGYILLIFGILLSTILIFSRRRFGGHETWNDFNSIHYKILIGYVVIVAISGFVFRLSFYAYENHWYKNSVKKKV